MVSAAHEVRPQNHSLIYSAIQLQVQMIQAVSPQITWDKVQWNTESHYLEKTSVLKERISNPTVPQTYFNRSLPHTLLIAWDVPFQGDTMHIQN